MNQRPVPRDDRVIPAAFVAVTPNQEQLASEDILFDKAERAEDRIEYHRLLLQSEIKKIEEVIGQAKGDECARLDKKLDRRRKQLAGTGERPSDRACEGNR